jgi:hypothetical protein
VPPEGFPPPVLLLLVSWSGIIWVQLIKEIIPMQIRISLKTGSLFFIIGGFRVIVNAEKRDVTLYWDFFSKKIPSRMIGTGNDLSQAINLLLM